MGFSPPCVFPLASPRCSDSLCKHQPENVWERRRATPAVTDLEQQLAAALHCCCKETKGGLINYMDEKLGWCFCPAASLSSLFIKKKNPFKHLWRESYPVLLLCCSSSLALLLEKLFFQISNSLIFLCVPCWKYCAEGVEGPGKVQPVILPTGCRWEAAYWHRLLAWVGQVFAVRDRAVFLMAEHIYSALVKHGACREASWLAPRSPLHCVKVGLSWPECHRPSQPESSYQSKCAGSGSVSGFQQKREKERKG